MGNETSGERLLHFVISVAERVLFSVIFRSSRADDRIHLRAVCVRAIFSRSLFDVIVVVVIIIIIIILIIIGGGGGIGRG